MHMKYNQFKRLGEGGRRDSLAQFFLYGIYTIGPGIRGIRFHCIPFHQDPAREGLY